MAEHSTFDFHAWPRRLNLGCGWDHRLGYVNIDFLAGHSPDLVADVRDLSMLPDEFYDEIVAQDVLEHLPRSDGQRALEEWSRLLRPFGQLRLRLPNVLGLAYLLTQKRALEEQQELIQCLYGTQAYDGDFHQNGYTELLLRHQLRNAGFGTIELTTHDEWLFDVVATKSPVVGELRFEDCPLMTLAQPSSVVAAAAPPPELTPDAGNA